MTKQTFYITVKIEIDSKLSLDDAISELGSECEYDFPSTENVRVIDTELMDISTFYPMAQ